MKIITIMPDFGMASYAWLSDDSRQGQGIGGCIADALSGFSGNEFNVSPGLTARFADWARKFERGAYENPAFPWKEFHEEGIELTRCLKTEIGTRARAIYTWPVEDPNAPEGFLEFFCSGAMVHLDTTQRRWRPGQ